MSQNKSLTCPQCFKALVPKIHQNIELDVCQDGCHGIWFDYGELFLLTQSDDFATLDATFEGTYEKKPVKDSLEGDALRRCPKDSVEMERFEWNVGSGIVMDSCPQCQGIWLDAGEMEGVAAFVQRFQRKPAEVPEELQEKAAHIHQTAMKTETTLNQEISRQIIRENPGVLDDVLRWLLKTVMPVSK